MSLCSLIRLNISTSEKVYEFVFNWCQLLSDRNCILCIVFFLFDFIFRAFFTFAYETKFRNNNFATDKGIRKSIFLADIDPSAPSIFLRWSGVGGVSRIYDRNWERWHREEERNAVIIRVSFSCQESFQVLIDFPFPSDHPNIKKRNRFYFNYYTGFSLFSRRVFLFASPIPFVLFRRIRKAPLGERGWRYYRRARLFPHFHWVLQLKLIPIDYI